MGAHISGQECGRRVVSPKKKLEPSAEAEAAKELVRLAKEHEPSRFSAPRRRSFLFADSDHSGHGQTSLDRTCYNDCDNTTSGS